MGKVRQVRSWSAHTAKGAGGTKRASETVPFSPCVGLLWEVPSKAVEEVEEAAVRVKRCKVEREEVGAWAKSKVDAKEEA